MKPRLGKGQLGLPTVAVGGGPGMGGLPRKGLDFQVAGVSMEPSRSEES